MMTSKRYSPDRFGNCFIPMSSMISRSGLRYFASTLSSADSALSWRKSRATSNTDRYSTAWPALIAWYPTAWTRKLFPTPGGTPRGGPALAARHPARRHRNPLPPPGRPEQEAAAFPGDNRGVRRADPRFFLDRGFNPQANWARRFKAGKRRAFAPPLELA